jgi:hypothetical protein
MSGMGIIEVLGDYEDEFDDDGWDEDEEDRQAGASPSSSDWVSQYDAFLKEDEERKTACKTACVNQRDINERLRPSSPVNVSLGSITYIPRREAPQHRASQTGSGVVVTNDGRFESIGHWLLSFNKNL